MTREQIQAGLPELPEPDDEDENVRGLVLFHEQEGRVLLADSIPLADAKAYCQRGDTRGDGWFVGLR